MTTRTVSPREPQTLTWPDGESATGHFPPETVARHEAMVAREAEIFDDSSCRLCEEPSCRGTGEAQSARKMRVMQTASTL